jgi:hypothetical protein
MLYSSANTVTVVVLTSCVPVFAVALWLCAQSFRLTFIKCVLATDLAHSFEYTSKFFRASDHVKVRHTQHSSFIHIFTGSTTASCCT